MWDFFWISVVIMTVIDLIRYATQDSARDEKFWDYIVGNVFFNVIWVIIVMVIYKFLVWLFS